MILAEDLDRMCYNADINIAREEGEGRIMNLYKWLYAQGRTDDFQKGSEDPEYRKTLLAEYERENPNG